MSHVYIHIVSRIIYSVYSAWYGKAIDIPCIRCSVKYFYIFFTQKKMVMSYATESGSKYQHNLQ